jgi:dipeptidyl aminopeptidase/acylaminoacyl peptidase
MTDTDQDQLDETIEPAAASEGEEQVAVGMESLMPPPTPAVFNVSPDGTTLAYLLAGEGGAQRLWLHPLDGDARALPLEFALVADRDGPQWSPDGRWLAVTGLHPDGSRTAIWLIDVEGGDARVLVDHAAADAGPRWSPDGTKIAFVSQRDGRGVIAVSEAGAASPSSQLTDPPPGQGDREPVWSKDSERVAFLRRGLEGTELKVVDHVWSVNLAAGELKQLTKKGSLRHSLRWGPERPLIVHVVEESEWDNLAVVNADNGAGWTLASEPGDKADPQWSADGARVIYTRAQGGVVRCCDRATSAASAILLDPDNGVAASPRWLPEKRVVYLFGGHGDMVRLITQENTADAERTEIPLGVWRTGRDVVVPTTLQVETRAGNKLSGFLYRQTEGSGLAPAVILLPYRPDVAQDARWRATEQALAAAGLAVYTPTMAGSRGLGRKLANALQAQDGRGEAEVSDLADVVARLRETDGIDPGRIAVAGRGFGATLALLLAGARPGSVQAVVAIDPVTDWADELDQADDDWRRWLLRVYGLPAAHPGAYALRTPSTFVGVIDAPLLLIGTDGAPPHRAAQLDRLASTLDELGVSHTRETALEETEWTIGLRVAEFLREAFRAVPEATPAEPPAAAAEESPSANGVSSENVTADDSLRTEVI